MKGAPTPPTSRQCRPGYSFLKIARRPLSGCRRTWRRWSPWVHYWSFWGPLLVCFVLLKTLWGALMHSGVCNRILGRQFWESMGLYLVSIVPADLGGFLVWFFLCSCCRLFWKCFWRAISGIFFVFFLVFIDASTGQLSAALSFFFFHLFLFLSD